MTNTDRIDNRSSALIALLEPDPAQKVRLTRLFNGLPRRRFTDKHLQHAVFAPGRPARPELIHPASVPRRGLGKPEGRAALLHAVAHIEFNAINLALDAAGRFADMPDDYYADWLQVAAEEALHFSLLCEHLDTAYGMRYGDLAAHNGLWEMAEKTADDVLARMGLVPRIMEARGLDVTPGIRQKLLQAGDKRAAEILDVILRDEVGHVAIGNHWFHHLCAERRLEPVFTFSRLMAQYGAPGIRPPLNLEARRRGGFDEAEIAWLEAQARSIQSLTGAKPCKATQ